MKPKPKLLVIDDGDRYIELAHALLRDYDYVTDCERNNACWDCPVREGCTLTHAHDFIEADRMLTKHPDVDVVLLDVAFPIPESRLVPSNERDLKRRQRFQGIDILGHLRRQRGDLPVVLMTSRDALPFADAAEALDVDEFVTLAGADAFDARALSLLIERVLARRRASAEGGTYRWGKTAAMTQVRREASILARTSLPMLILGETGTGKSALAARFLHPQSKRGGDFVPVDLSSLPENLMAAELFGTTRGAFSGATDRPGRFEEADNGTLFLDEVGNLPLEAQRMLLVALTEGHITRLGENRQRAVNVKVIAATNADLPHMVRAGTFRADLYARLNPAARLDLSPLRERTADIADLMRDFVRRQFASGPDRTLLIEYWDRSGLHGAPRAELSLGKAPKDGAVHFVLSRSSRAELNRHPWPGNIRELEFFIANAVLFSLADALRVAESGRGHTTHATTIPIPAKLVRQLLAKGWVSAQEPAMPPAAQSTPPSSVNTSKSEIAGFEAGVSLRDVARNLERTLYIQLFRETNGDFEAMATALLTTNDPNGARKTRLRFNQLGLSVRKLRKEN